MTSFIIGCVADDFTGGSDAASFLKKGRITNGPLRWDSFVF